MIVLGGALVIGLFPIGKVIAVFYFGGAAIVVAVIVSIYEVIMIAFALIERVNHPARLVVVSTSLQLIKLKEGSRTSVA